MKKTSTFKFIITMVIVFFSTTIKAQSAQINAATDFSDYVQSASPTYVDMLQSPYGFKFYGAQRYGKMLKGYSAQWVDSVNVSFKIIATYMIGGSADFMLKVRGGYASDDIIYYNNQAETQTTYTYNHTFKTSDTLYFDTLYVTLITTNSPPCPNCNYSGTITIDSLKIIGYKQSGSIWTENGTVDIEENSDNVTNINTYPNPNNGVFNLSFETKNTNTPIKIVDPQGRIIYENYEVRQIGKNTIDLQLKNIAPGMYYINTGTHLQKVVIVK